MRPCWSWQCSMAVASQATGVDESSSAKTGYALALRFRVAAAFFADATRAALGRAAAALPPRRPPFLLETCVSFTPRPLPDLLPPPDSLLTVAQARRWASFFGRPRSS